MNILLITNKFNLGGAETHVLEQALSLKKDGHNVTVASAGGIYELVLMNNGIEHISLPLDTRQISCMIESYFAIKKLIKENKYDIVHAHARIPAFICHLIRKKLKFHFVTTCHYNFKNKGYTKKYTYWGEHVFSISDDIDSYLMDTYDIKKKNISRVVNGIDTNKFKKDKPIIDLIEKYNLQGKKVIYTTARLDEGSSEFISNCIKAVISLREKYPNLVYMVSGNGENYNKFVELANNINDMYSSQIIIFTNAVFNVYDYLNLSSIFIGPSRSALEAISSSVPTIVSGAQGHIGLFCENNKYECIKTNFCSRKHNLANEMTYAKEIDEILSMNDSELNDIKEYGRKFILENYSTDIMKNQYEKEYERISKLNFESSAVICGYYGNDNMGDELLLSNIISGLRKENNSVQFSVISSNTKKTKRDNNVNAIGKYNIGKIKSELSKTKLLIFGGGNIFQDKTSLRSFNYYSFISKLACENGARVVLLGNGIGPISNKKCKEKFAEILNYADYISLRDNESYEYVKNIKEENVFLTGDYVTDVSNNENQIFDNEYFLIFPKEGQYDKNILISFINSIKSEYKLNCIVAPLNKKEDMKISNQIAKETNSTVINTTNEDEILNLIANSRFSVSMRLHSSVLSANNGIPFISIYDDNKIYQFSKDISSKLENLCIPYKSLDEQRLKKSIKDIYANEYDLKEILNSSYISRKEKIACDYKRVVEKYFKE